MSQTLERGVSMGPPGPPVPKAARADPRGRRRVRWIVLPLAVLLVAGLVAGSVYLAHLQPLEAGSYGIDPLPPARDIGSFSAPSGGPVFSVVRIPFDQGKQVTWGYSIKNDGPVAITVTGIDGVDPDWGGPLKITDVLVGKQTMIRSIGRAPSLYEPFHAFALAPGQERMVFFRALMTNCLNGAGGFSSTYTGQFVHFQVLGMHRTQWLATPTEIEVDAGADPCSTG